MKYVILSLLLISSSVQACLIQFQVTTEKHEEQKKGPVKKIIEVLEDHSIDADSILRFSYDINSEPKSDNLIFYFKNNTQLNIGFSEELKQEIKKQMVKCKGK